ncbi:relaxase/mobilization nuclease domain-containing protein [Fibrella aquatica]|uniref:relaxase/mobilization nuclease domain-containing protein n=1 Tax=Fibrella aquatica TaxID=3242487 RepID=UPI00352246F4
MVAKIIGVKSISSTARYVKEGYGDVDKKAELLEANGVRMGTAAQIAADFERHAQLNPDIKRAGLHIPLAFSAQDIHKLSDQRLVDLSLKYMREMKIEPETTQWIIVKHGDTDHPHVHLLMNKIGLDGKAIDLSFSKMRSKKAVKKIAEEEGLTVAETQVYRPDQIKRPHLEKRHELIDAVRQLVEAALQKAHTISDFRKSLAAVGIEVIWKTSKKSEGAIKGVRFVKDGRNVSGSALGQEFSGSKLYKRLSEAHKTTIIDGKDDAKLIEKNSQLKPKPVTRQQRM